MNFDPAPGPAVSVVRLDADLPLPAYAHAHDAGCDLVAREDVTVPAGGGRATVGTGLALALPPGYAGFILPRSGLAAGHGLTLANAPGLLDAGYRNELKVALLNTHPTESFEVRRGDRIAQLVVQRVEQIQWVEVAELPPSERGLGGFGSTGGVLGAGPPSSGEV